VRSRAARDLWRLSLLLLAVTIPNSGCARSEGRASRARVEWSLNPSKAIVGPATLTITLHGPSGELVRGASVTLEAYMSHPGMAPVQARATERAPGTYEVPFAFTMQGDWVLLVSAALADGEHVEQRIDIANVRPG
jgi:hypothetical protein